MINNASKKSSASVAKMAPIISSTLDHLLFLYIKRGEHIRMIQMGPTKLSIEKYIGTIEAQKTPNTRK